MSISKGSTGGHPLVQCFIQRDRERERDPSLAFLLDYNKRSNSIVVQKQKNSCVFVSTVQLMHCECMCMRVHVHGDHHPTPTPSLSLTLFCTAFYVIFLCIEQAVKMHKFVVSLSRVVRCICTRRPFPYQYCGYACRRYKTLDNVYGVFFSHKL